MKLTGQDHEYRNDTVHIGTLEMTYAVVVVGKTSGAHCGKGMGNGIEKIQSSYHEEDGLDDGKSEVREI